MSLSERFRNPVALAWTDHAAGGSSSFLRTHAPSIWSSPASHCRSWTAVFRRPVALPQPASSSQPVLRRRGSCDVHAASQRVPRSRGGPWRRGGPSWRSTRAQQGRGARLGRPLRAVEALQHVVRWVPRKHLRPSRVQLNPLHFGDSNWNGDNYPLTSPIV